MATYSHIKNIARATVGGKYMYILSTILILNTNQQINPINQLLQSHGIMG